MARNTLINSTISHRVGIRNISDYSPFGVLLKERTVENEFFRRGYNGMETDPEIKGKGNSYSSDFRQFDPRIGRWFTIDPKFGKYPDESPYLAFHNNPIHYSDPRGDDPPEELLAAFNSTFKKAWKESFVKFNESGKSVRTSETGAVLIKKTVAEEVNGEIVQKTIYDVHNYEVSPNDYIELNYRGVPEGWEIVGDFHTHPWSDKETKSQLNKQPNFDPSATPFSFKDLYDTGDQIKKGNIGEGDVSFVVTEKAVYGLIITNEKAAKKFLTNSGMLGSLENKEINIQNGTTNPNEGEAYGDAMFRQIIEEKTEYEAVFGDSGVEFIKMDVDNSTNENKGEKDDEK